LHSPLKTLSERGETRVCESLALIDGRTRPSNCQMLWIAA
jgi:hypothetical protein